jgi:Zn-finger nucleic acid-binding protein
MYLNCPVCHLSLRAPRAAYMAPEHCPRCIGRRRVATPLIASELPLRQLAAQQAAQDPAPPPQPAE